MVGGLRSSCQQGMACAFCIFHRQADALALWGRPLCNSRYLSESKAPCGHVAEKFHMRGVCGAQAGHCAWKAPEAPILQKCEFQGRFEVLRSAQLMLISTTISPKLPSSRTEALY